MQYYLAYVANFSFALTLNLVISNFLPIQGIAFTPINEVAQYKPPTNIGAPSTTAAGGSRSGSCPQNQKDSGPSITALKPDLTLAYGLGLTISTNPQFFVYLPQSPAKTAEFVLKDEEEKDVYRKSLQISGEPGIVSLTLPQNVAKLEAGKNYHWYFVVICNSRNRRQDIFVDGLIRRIELPSTLAAELQNATERDRPKLYAEAGIWHEAVAELAELRRKNPNDTGLADEWKKLLESAGIKQIGEFPFTLTQLETSP